MFNLIRRTLTFGAIAALLLTGATTVTANAKPAPQSTHQPAVKTAPASQSQSGQRRACYRYCYGSISLARDGAWGSSRNYRGITRAKRIANRQCRSHSNRPRSCRNMGWVRNQCMAVVAKKRRGYVVRARAGAAVRKARAWRRAMRKCGGTCKRVTIVCNGSRY